MLKHLLTNEGTRCTRMMIRSTVLGALFLVAANARAEEKKATAVLNTPVLPAPAMKNAKLESEMARALSAEWRSDKVLKVVIIDKSWDVEMFKRHPVARKLHTKVAVQQKKQCRVFDVTFAQKAKASGFGTTEYYSVGDNEKVACEALPK